MFFRFKIIFKRNWKFNLISKSIAERHTTINININKSSSQKREWSSKNSSDKQVEEECMWKSRGRIKQGETYNNMDSTGVLAYIWLIYWSAGGWLVYFSSRLANMGLKSETLILFFSFNYSSSVLIKLRGFNCVLMQLAIISSKFKHIQTPQHSVEEG